MCGGGFLFFYVFIGCRTHHLQPVVEAGRAPLRGDALDVKAVAEVQGDGEAS